MENPAAIYMENNFRGLSFSAVSCFQKKDQVGWGVNLLSSYNKYAANHDVPNMSSFEFAMTAD